MGDTVDSRYQEKEKEKVKTFGGAKKVEKLWLLWILHLIFFF